MVRIDLRRLADVPGGPLAGFRSPALPLDRVRKRFTAELRDTG